MPLVRPHYPELNHRLTGGEALELGAKFEDLLRLGDLERQVDSWIQTQRVAEAALNRQGYAVWGQVPRHPFAAGVSAFHNWLEGGARGFPASVRPFLEWAYLVERFRPDWESAADKFAAELRAKKLATIFELLVGHQFRLSGHSVKYVFPQDGPGRKFDLLLSAGAGIEVECKLVRAYEPIIEELASQLFPGMIRRNQHRVVLIHCLDTAKMSDINVLVEEIKPLIRESVATTYMTRNGRYSIRVTDGGSSSVPLSTDQIGHLSRQLDTMDHRLSEHESMSRVIAVPNRGFIRGIGLTMEKPPSYGEQMVKAACDASSQLTGTRPGIVAVGLDTPLPRDQTGLRDILSQVRLETLRRLSSKSAASGLPTKVSSVSLLLAGESNGEPAGPAIGGGLTRSGWTDGLHYPFPNPHARHQLPASFRMTPRPRGFIL